MPLRTNHTVSCYALYLRTQDIAKITLTFAVNEGKSLTVAITTICIFPYHTAKTYGFVCWEKRRSDVTFSFAKRASDTKIWQNAGFIQPKLPLYTQNAIFTTSGRARKHS